MATIDLTRQEVVDTLAEFEEKLPNIGTELYRPDMNIKAFDLSTINMEAAKMLRFIGAHNYTSVVRLEDLSGRSAAGFAKMGGSVDKVFEIVIDQNTLNDVFRVYRVLAHELCHKYLELFGLYTGVLTSLDEVRAELCTIFMGFGGLVLYGYDEATGYLKLEDFCHAFCVVYQSRGWSDEQIIDIVPPNCKALAERILLEMQALQSKKVSELIIAGQMSDYELRRRIRMLQLVFENMTEIKEKHLNHDKILRGKQKELRDDKHPILKMLLRETMAINLFENKIILNCCDELDRIVNELCEATAVDIEKVSEGLAKDVVCPACGFVNGNTRVNGLKALRCPKCNHYFVWDGRPFERRRFDLF